MLKKKSYLISLNLFLDSCGLLKVGDLRNANLPETVKHPLLLQKNHPITNMLIKFHHQIYMHGGMKLINSAMKQEYWIVGAKTTIRKEVPMSDLALSFRSKLWQIYQLRK
ncbi:uncharacterized protein NPIL_266661 [Nephila pilipes]|uniref:Uncharacterized protein n=1 Tax=Nephila pilipes TaxID=299642 RepID=A0A8X6Q0X1_NEPPI|nr:uncharacterized protein NPIL_266661 [Nephila pilipes]